jgi:hypothetical protein
LNQYIRITTVIATAIKAGSRFSNQTKTSPIKAVRKGRNIYIEEFYIRKLGYTRKALLTGLLYRMG